MSTPLNAWRRDRRTPLFLACAGIWLLAVVTGFAYLTNYEFTAGVAAAAPGQWPTEAQPLTNDGRPTLLLIAHPRCPCTVATVNELARLMPKLQDQARIKIALYRPDDEPESWAKGAVWRASKQIPDVEIEFDRDGELARALGGSTSGHAMVFDAAGALLFSGGLTASRGHEGASVGTGAVLSWIRDGHGPPTTPVFGCALFTASDLGAE